MVPVLIPCIIGLCALPTYNSDTVLKSIGLDLRSLSEIKREGARTEGARTEGARTEGARAHARATFDQRLIITHPHFDQNLESYPVKVLS